MPSDRAGWAALAATLGVKAIHIAERDTQVADEPKRPGEFVNTWSIDGFVGEGCQPAELGWGTHERHLPADGRRHDFGCGAAIYLQRPGAGTRVRTWTPLEGPFHGFLITHDEVDLDRRLPDRARGRRGRATGRPCTTPTTRATTRCCRCTSWPARNWQLQTGTAADDGRDHPRHRRARRAADGPARRAPTGTARS